ncbi:MAG TPA: cobalamin biosynthesis protein [Beijerinckiaceae bacterium]|nr:cobalamin biosynthesis protein [Beijerinckiaceae bacterium]HVB89952.1 cobalamin biosynthesis protein [Beijerinckiaceae bacterium]
MSAVPASFALAIGLGCKSNCSAKAIVTLVRSALAQAGEEGPAALFTMEAKRGESGLALAAAELALPLFFLPLSALQGVAGLAQTRSAKVIALFGVPSIAETAALAGAGPAATLIVPRIKAGGAACAIARAAIVEPVERYDAT